MVASVYYSFTEYPILTAPKWVGLENYRLMFTDDEFFYQSLKVTIVYSTVSVPLAMVLGFSIAILLNQDIRLVALSGIVLEYQELGLTQFPFHAQPPADLSCLFQIVGGNNAHPFRSQVAGDFPVPHGHDPKLGGKKEQWEFDLFQLPGLLVRISQKLGKDNGLSLGEGRTQGHRLQYLRFFGQ